MMSLPASERPPHEVAVPEQEFGALLGTLFFEATAAQAQLDVQSETNLDRNHFSSAVIQERSSMPMNRAKVVIVSEGIMATWCASDPDILVSEFPSAVAIFAALPGSNNHSFTRIK